MLLADPAHNPAIAPSLEKEAAMQAKRTYSETMAQHKKDSHNVEAAWQFARACFDLGEFAANSTERAALAEQGVAASRQVLARDPNSAPGHYYLAMNLGQLARTKGLGALKLVDQMELQFSKARELDEHFDYAGSDRHLGVLYREAPSVGSIGSRSKARKHLERAAALAPEYPANGLNLLEAYLKWGERNGARRELKALEAVWPKARTKFTGQPWSAAWADWEQRLKDAKKKVEEPSKAIEPPRQKA
jgi:tetratricopeptide (TPR) repeat protein